MDEQPQATIPPKATPTPATAPGAPRPITVRLKPITPTPSGTSPAVEPAAPASADAATVKLRPVTPPPSMTAPILPPSTTAPISPAQVAATVQAAKSKTSRISLDSAIGVATSIPIAPPDTTTPKTIRLKRPTDLGAPATTAAAPVTPQNIKSPTAAIIPAVAPPPSSTAPIRQTSRIPDSAIPSEAISPTPVIPAPAATADSATVTQKKTLKIRRPGVPVSGATVSADTGSGADTSLDGIALTPISEIEFAGPSKGYKVFSVIAVTTASIAAILMLVLNWCLAADAIAPMANKNTAASIPLNAPVSWPGKFVE